MTYIQLSFDFRDEEKNNYQNFEDFGITKNLLYHLIKESFRECYNNGFNIVDSSSKRVTLEWHLSKIKIALDDDYYRYELVDDVEYCKMVHFDITKRQEVKKRCFYNRMRGIYIRDLIKKIEDIQFELKYMYETRKKIKDTIKDLYFNDFRTLEYIKTYLLENPPASRFQHQDCSKTIFKMYPYYEEEIDSAISLFKFFYIEQDDDKDLLKRVNDKINERVNFIIRRENDQEIKETHFDKCRSKDEFKMYELLTKKYGKENVLKEYKCNKYPFHCDFYIKSKDLFIEYQGFYSHGDRKFVGDEGQIRQLKQLIDRNNTACSNIINTWAFSDVVKRKIAEINGLNWIEFYNIENFEKWIRKSA